MKVIDVLDTSYYGKPPSKFKTNNNEIYEYDEHRGYIRKYIGGWFYLFEDLKNGYIRLNDEVEIIGEDKKDNFSGWKMYQNGKEVCVIDCTPKEDKKIEKLETYKETDDEDHYANILKVSKNGECEITEGLSIVVDKVNEIIDKLNEMSDKE